MLYARIWLFFFSVPAAVYAAAPAKQKVPSSPAKTNEFFQCTTTHFEEGHREGMHEVQCDQQDTNGACSFRMDRVKLTDSGGSLTFHTQNMADAATGPLTITYDFDLSRSTGNFIVTKTAAGSNDYYFVEAYTGSCERKTEELKF